MEGTELPTLIRTTVTTTTLGSTIPPYHGDIFAANRRAIQSSTEIVTDKWTRGCDECWYRPVPADLDHITIHSKRPVPMLRAFLCSGASTLLNICGNFHKKRKVFSNLLCVVDKPYYIYVPLGCKDAIIMDALC